MLRILGSRKKLCDRITRREMIQAGGLTAFGLGLSDLLAGASLADVGGTGPSATFGKAKRCILLFLYGAVSQLDTFDPKPQAPEDIRGPFSPIATALPGVHLAEHLPRLAQKLDQVTLVRSMSHEHPIHGVAYAVTGIDRVDIPMELNRRDTRHWPFFGSVLDYLDEQDHPGGAPASIPKTVHLPWDLSSRSAPHKRAGTFGGFLGPAYDPVVIEFAGNATPGWSYRPNDPYGGVDASCRFEIAATERRDGLTLDRLDSRRNLLTQFDEQRRHLENTEAGQSLDHFQQMAYSVLAGADVRRALDLNNEPAAIRERYGYHLFGQSTLLARRLIESGTRLATVFWDEFGVSCGAWDTHEKQTRRLKEELCPGFDQTFTALLDDLEQRGLLDETLVLVMTEHGRTPQAERRGGTTDGRGHWSQCYSCLMAGAGIARGLVLGTSDRNAGWVHERPVDPKEILQTAYHLLGVNTQRTIQDNLGRPLPLVAGGKPIGEVLAG